MQTPRPRDGATKTKRRTARSLTRALCVLAIVGLAAGSLAAAELRKPVSSRVIEAFFAPYVGENTLLSRDGTRLAFLSANSAVMKITIVGVEDWKRAEFTLPEGAGAGVRAFEWVAPDLLLVVTETPALVVLDLKSGLGRKVLDAEMFSTVTFSGDSVPRPPRYLGLVPDEPGFALVEGASAFRAGDPDATPAEERLDVFDVVKVDLRTGALTPLRYVVEDRETLLLYDQQGHPRIKQQRVRLPQTFSHLPAGKAGMWARWQELDRLVGAATPLGFEVTPRNFFGERSFPLCFDRDPNVLYCASNVGRDTYGIFRLDLRTNAWTEVAASKRGRDLANLREPCSENTLILERASGRCVGVRAAAAREIVWLDEELANVQSTLERKFPRRDVEIAQWDDGRGRFLFQVASLTDPGRTFVYHRADGRCVEFQRRAPWLDPDAVHAVEAFDVNTAAGERLVGRVTLPRAPRLPVPPLIVHFHDGPGQAGMTEFDREAQALAAMGCMVLQLEYRGSAGLGRRHGELPPDAMDRIPVEDTLAAMDWLAKRHRFDRRRVGLVGEGLGGYIALRALALHPDAFRCAVSINAPTSLEQMHERPGATPQEMGTFVGQMRGALPGLGSASGAGALGGGGDEEGGVVESESGGRVPSFVLELPPPVDFEAELSRWIFARGGFRAASPSVLGQVEKITQPVFLIHDQRHPIIPLRHVRDLQRALRKRGGEVEYLEVSAPFTEGNLRARAPVFVQIHAFLNATLYDFGVKIGPTEVVD